MLALTLLLACGGSPEVAAPVDPVVFADDAADATMSPAVPGLLTEAEFAALHALSPEAAPALRGQAVQLADGSGAYLSVPASGVPAPGVVVVHEWWGLNDHIRHWADRLAEDGYAALAVDLYGGRVATTSDEAMATMKSVDEEVARATLAAAHAFLVEDPRVQAPRTGVIGWCFGGGWSLRLALAEPELDAAVVYYGRLVTEPEALRPLSAPLLGVFATRDKGIPGEAVDAFEAALGAEGKRATIHRYEAEHAFANPSSARYDAAAAGEAWEEVRAFLAAELRGPAATR